MTPRSPPTHTFSGANSFTCTDVSKMHLTSQIREVGEQPPRRVQQNRALRPHAAPCRHTEGPLRGHRLLVEERQGREGCGAGPRQGRRGQERPREAVRRLCLARWVLEPGPGLRRLRWSAGSPVRAGVGSRAWGGDTHECPCPRAESAPLASAAAPLPFRPSSSAAPGSQHRAKAEGARRVLGALGGSVRGCGVPVGPP